jgi:hypothetical protein
VSEAASPDWRVADILDRRLVTNLLLQFLTTPRADAKRFEMLSLIASVLDFTEEQRETAGLQRGGNATSSWRGKGRAGAQQGAQSPQAVGDEVSPVRLPSRAPADLCACRAVILESLRRVPAV